MTSNSIDLNTAINEYEQILPTLDLSSTDNARKILEHRIKDLASKEGYKVSFDNFKVSLLGSKQK